MYEVQKSDGSKVSLSEDQIREQVREGKLVFEIMDHTGDTKKIWDPTSEVEVEDARASFDRLKRAGYAAFRVNEKGDAGEQMKEFDPAAGRVIMRPPMQGG